MEELIYKYFPDLTDNQKEMFSSLYPVYTDWNSKINVISRKDIENLYLHHVLHSLAIAKIIQFPAGSKVLDVGTGGGFPGIPLAILFQDTSFHLCDSIMKKIRVVNEVAAAVKLVNVTAQQIRAEALEEKYDFIVSRAVTDLKDFLPWIWKNIEPGNCNGIPRGIIYLKGGELTEEISNAQKRMKITSDAISTEYIKKWFDEPFFEQKQVIYIKR